MTASSLPVVPSLVKIACIEVRVTPPIILGELSGNERRLISIAGGKMTIEGQALVGTILPGGSDIQLVRSDGTIELTARYAIDFGPAGSVLIENTGIRRESTRPAAGKQGIQDGAGAEPAYFRGVMQFRAPSGELSWLNGSVFVTSGRREGATVYLDVFEVQ